ncbi:FadR/GntR family transcriptional regulator [Tsukamurella spumae]|uniref:FadR family transcriptional regulator n=1 Tax=Tsukamurella spumae TaxID=44753 RepID=A0A846X6F1_9ACTN|nr:GntR family transcriptional regulator [Tsukamurella spumae]NKY19889.1 FadR family transcriptional regulator [Tsukamurella spumae]
MTVQVRPPRSLVGVFSPVRTTGLADEVAARISGAVDSGLLVAGQRLPTESELAAVLGVSAVTVREALARLRAEGVITTTRGRTGGSFVAADPVGALARAQERLAGMSKVGLSDLGQHYEAVTAHCARLAARRAGPADLAELRAVIGPTPDEGGGAAALAVAARRAESEFAIEVATIGRSARLAHEVVLLQSELGPLALLPNDDEEYRRAAEVARGAVSTALAARDPDRAGAAMRALVGHEFAWLIAHRAEAEEASGT